MRHALNLKSLLSVLLISAAMFSTSVRSQTSNVEKVIKKSEIENLKSGIASYNLGLKRSSVYLAGRYQIKEVANDIKKQLLNECDFNTKMLMLQSLYRIDEQKASEAALHIVQNDTDRRIIEVASLLYLDYANRSSERYVRNK